MLRIMKASAGSGKTYNLAKTYIGLLLRNEDRYAYRHILAVTFTNKATEEMKSRILQELHVLATTPEKSDYLADFVPEVFQTPEKVARKANAVLCDILHDYGAFAISTIDRFFQQTLKAFSREIGQFASYQVELDKDTLISESVDRILDSLSEDDGFMLSWLTDNVMEELQQGKKYKLESTLARMSKKLLSAQRQDELDRNGIGDKAVMSIDSLLQVREACRKVIRDFASSVEQHAKDALAEFISCGVQPQDTYRGFMSKLGDYEKIEQAWAIEIPTPAFLKRAASVDDWFSSANKRTLFPKVSSALVTLVGQFCSLWGREYDVYRTACILDKQICVLGIAAELRSAYEAIMKEKNVLCLDDSNAILKGIIGKSDAPFVYEKTGVRYEHFLLDEFQDTSAVQWSNFSPLVANSDSQGCENLVVGDVKQSIYRWRGSHWKLLDAVIPSEFASHRTEVLDTNYRSMEEIVNFNNVFFRVAARILDKISGHKKAPGPMGRIYSDVRQKVSPKKKGGGIVSMTFCPKEQELDEVLKSVRGACQAGASLSEIAVLVRNKDEGKSIAIHLINNGIGVITDDSLKVKNSLIVRRLVSLLSYIDNPADAVNAYMSRGVALDIPAGAMSLTDMVESLFRVVKKSDDDGLCGSEALYIQSFLDAVKDYSSSYGNNLRGFLKYWEGKDPSISMSQGSECVRIMTIHKSKGLAFPYVIIPYAEKISLYKAENSWCVPDLESTPLQGVAEGVYDVCLSEQSEHTLFKENYRQERFLQQVDNINTLYVAMTRPVYGVHVIAQKPEDKNEKFTDFSQILHWFALRMRMDAVESDGTVTFTRGTMPDFNSVRKTEEQSSLSLDVAPGEEFPSIPLNSDPGDALTDVRVRGRLKFSSDALEFFEEDSPKDVPASRRVKGIVLHDILSRVRVPDDLGPAVSQALDSGVIASGDLMQVKTMLESAVADGAAQGWFPEDGEGVMREISLMKVGGEVLRPDRVIVRDGSVVVIDYKFGEPSSRYEDQVRQYADVFREMGYSHVSAWLWYIPKGVKQQVV